MSKIRILLIVLSSLILYFTFLIFNNGKVLIINISIPNKNTLTTKLYYKTNLKAPYSEKKSLTPFKIEGNKYYFDISKIKHLQKFRFDPEIHNNLDMTIYSVNVIKNVWFQKTLFFIPFNSIKPRSGVSSFKVSKVITFKTTNKDSQLEIEPNFTIDSKSLNLNIDKFILSIIISLIIFYIFSIHKTENLNENLRAKLILYSLFFMFILFKGFYYKDNVHFGYPPDERAHLSYIKFVNSNHNFVTHFKDMPNYLSHPPLYYELENLAFDKTKSIGDNVDNFRTLSLSIFALATLLFLYFGFSAKLSILGDFVFLSLIASLPMYSYIGASISNDNLALLGAAIFLLGFKRFFENKIDYISFILISIGGAVAYFSKLTAALLIFFAIIYFCLFFARREFFSKIKLAHIAILVAFLTPIIYYQASIMLEYHSLVPTYNVTHPKEFLQSGFYTAPEYRLHLTPQEWFFRLIHYIQIGWFAIHSHHSFGHSSWLGVIGLVIIHIFAILALFFRCKSSTYCLFGKIILLSLFSVELVQYLFSYKAHIANGYMGGLQPRYLLPFMVGFAIMASIFVEKFKKYFWWNILIIFISIQAIYSDFFYFLLYYK